MRGEEGELVEGVACSGGWVGKGLQCVCVVCVWCVCMCVCVMCV